MRSAFLTSLIVFTLFSRAKCQLDNLDAGTGSEDNFEINENTFPFWAMSCFEPHLQEDINEYIRIYGNVGDWEELYRIHGVTVDHIICLYEENGPIDFSGFSPSPKKLILRLRHDIRPNGERDQYGVDHYGRIRYKNSFHEDIFFQWEHDKGEWNKSHTRFPDYYSGYFQKRFSKKKWEILLGDYHLSWGQGLLAYNGLFASPGSGIQNLIRSKIRYSGNRSKTETGNYRGIVIQSYPGSKQNDRIIAWYSRSSLNTSLKKDTHNKDYWQSLDLSGDHSSESLIRKKGALNWSSSGILFSHERIFNMSAAVRWDRFSHPFLPGEAIFRSGLPQYRELFSGSFAFDGNLDHITLWGEYAIQSKGGIAMIQGASIPLNSNWKAGCLTRFANRRFHGLFGAPFFKRNPPHNEWGVYLSVEGSPVKGLIIRTYWNSWHFTGIRYLFDSPSSGMRWALLLEKKKRKSYQGSIQILWDADRKKKDNDITSLSGAISDKIRCRFHLEKKISSSSLIKLRVEFAGIPDNWKRSLSRLVYLGYSFKPLQSPWKISSRITWTDIDNYDLRIAAFESDVLGRFRINSYFRKEIHANLSVRYKFPFGMTVDLYSRYIFQNSFEQKQLPWSHTIQIQYSLEME